MSAEEERYQFPKPGDPLYNRFKNYITTTNSAYRPEFHVWCVERGWMNPSDRADQYVEKLKKQIEKSGEFPKPGDSLYARFSGYISSRHDCYRPEFREWCVERGWMNRSDRAKQVLETLKQQIETSGVFPKEGDEHYNTFAAAISSKTRHKAYCSSFYTWCKERGFERPVERADRFLEKLKQQIERSGTFPKKGNPLFSHFWNYRYRNPEFKTWCEERGYKTIVNRVSTFIEELKQQIEQSGGFPKKGDPSYNRFCRYRYHNLDFHKWCKDRGWENQTERADRLVEEIKQQIEQSGGFPKKGDLLYRCFREYIYPSSGTYRPKFYKWCEERGWGR